MYYLNFDFGYRNGIMWENKGFAEWVSTSGTSLLSVTSNLTKGSFLLFRRWDLSLVWIFINDRNALKMIRTKNPLGWLIFYSANMTKLVVLEKEVLKNSYFDMRFLLDPFSSHLHRKSTKQEDGTTF